ncbi:hypothetical protein [Pedobacter flavus]|uniref:Carboxypeptidase-like regulatory domain-containing protein n=1 Tax=Pedobacter flavus TaxID=3113906 RepID=A0ABU7H009_9SPHI|nr:hypothetical protein [Pedobacter sp. VNH31]MEE1884402.1 hypothetical protein [Pedobacter sp. VNH31]
MPRISLFLIFLFTALTPYAQTVQGFVLNKNTKLRLAQVYIYNEKTEEGIYNNSKGEFTIKASKGDVIYAAREGYGLDTIVYNGEAAIYFQLIPLAIQIEKVEITSKSLDPQAEYLRNVKEYKQTLDKGLAKEVFSIRNATVGLSINAIYNLLSKQGKNARYLQKILERDYKEKLIDYKFRPDLVARVLNIKEPELSDFMSQYRPTYNFILNSTDYALIVFIKNSYASYKRSPAAFRLPILPINEDVDRKM